MSGLSVISGKRPNSWPAKLSYTPLCSKKQEAVCVNSSAHQQCFWYFTVCTSLCSDNTLHVVMH